MTRSTHVHPWVFMILIVPFGLVGGYLSVAIGYVLKQGGVSVGQIASLVALSLFPHTWKFLFAPAVDTTLTRKQWYLIGSILSGAGLWLTGAMPFTQAGFAALSVVVFIGSLATACLGMAVESLMAYGSNESEKGRAGGWFQAGNLGGAGVGGGVGLWLTQRLPEPWMAGAILGAVCLMCAIPLIYVTEPVATHRAAGFVRGLREVGRDLWGLCRSRLGFLAMGLCFLPIGSGAASGLWSAVAGDWKASANAVALATGVFSGIAAAFGCIGGGWISDRMNRKVSYLLYGVLQAICVVAMALAPRTESMYIVFTLLYSVISGLTYAGFTAFTLEAIGTGAAATKYNLLASLSNMPIYYMTTIDGMAHDRWGASGMLYAEAVMAMIGLSVFGLFFAAVQARGRVAAPATVAPAAVEP